MKYSDLPECLPLVDLLYPYVAYHRECEGIAFLHRTPLRDGIELLARNVAFPDATKPTPFSPLRCHYCGAMLMPDDDTLRVTVPRFN